MAGCLDRLDKTKQSKTEPQERCNKGDRSDELISLAMPPSTFTTKTMEAAMGRSKEFEHLVLFDSI